MSMFKTVTAATALACAATSVATVGAASAPQFASVFPSELHHLPAGSDEMGLKTVSSDSNSVKASPAWNLGLALEFLEYSASAYCDASKIKDWSCSRCVDKVKDLQPDLVIDKSITGDQGYTGVNHKTKAVVVAFRGSVNIQNWIDNLDFGKEKPGWADCAGCEIHSGFLASYNSMKKDIRASALKLMTANPGYKIHITGHSLGAAISVICAYDFHYEVGFDANDISIINFGEPRVGNEAFSQVYHNTFPDALRVVHYNDIVPHLPPDAFGFHHVPTEAWEQKDGTVKVCNSTGEDKSCSWSVPLYDYSAEAHLTYLGVSTQCDGNPVVTSADEENADYHSKTTPVTLDAVEAVAEYFFG
eukprot:GFYU01017445.1.p1 GENE.GFYU01017445.1~~GFYU01017445.1.p1  ORF type:complete len:360 (-),score=123.05 GFYU01017445.1:116-1195(-)